MWETRSEALKELSGDLKEEGELIYKGFELLDEIIEIFTRKPDCFNRVCGIVLLKGKNLCKAMFSLALDGLAQESGALLRPTIECFELLAYLRDDPERVEEAVENRLPSAGNIAKKIDGDFKDLREHLNKNASHISLSSHSVSHLIDFESEEYRMEQLYNEQVLRKNLTTLFVIMFNLIFEGVNCIKINGEVPANLPMKIKNWKDNGLKIVDHVY